MWIHFRSRRSKTSRIPRPAYVRVSSTVESGPRMTGVTHDVPLNGATPSCSIAKSRVRSPSTCTSAVWLT